MSFGHDVIEATCDGRKYGHTLRGLIVGRFIVRPPHVGEEWVSTLGAQKCRPKPWVVHHMPSGLCWSFETLSIALGVADDLNLYAKRDPTSSSIDQSKLRRQIGAELYDWVDAIDDQSLEYIPYRQFRKRAGA
jgi:hypothetical protein